jgi:hypothetical protein
MSRARPVENHRSLRENHQLAATRRQPSKLAFGRMKLKTDDLRKILVFAATVGIGPAL